MVFDPLIMLPSIYLGIIYRTDIAELVNSIIKSVDVLSNFETENNNQGVSLRY